MNCATAILEDFSLFASPRLLLSECTYDPERLAKLVNGSVYFSIDEYVPCLRFRGTMIKRKNNLFEIVGWQRNVARLQKMDLSLPTVIRITASPEMQIEDISLDSCFNGSKGLLCHCEYLRRNLRKKLLKRTLLKDVSQVIKPDFVHCFHIMEIMLAIESNLSVMQQRGLDRLFEQEVGDSCVVGKDLLILLRWQSDFINEEICGAIKLENGMRRLGFKKDGSLFAISEIKAIFSVAEIPLLSRTINGNCDVRLMRSLKYFCVEAVKMLTEKFYPERNGIPIAHTNLQYQAFIGLIVQVLSMKKYNNNYNQVLHTLNSLQRVNNKPRCVGAIDSQKEADRFFSGYNLKDILL